MCFDRYACPECGTSLKSEIRVVSFGARPRQVGCILYCPGGNFASMDYCARCFRRNELSHALAERARERARPCGHWLGHPDGRARARANNVTRRRGDDNTQVLCRVSSFFWSAGAKRCLMYSGEPLGASCGDGGLNFNFWRGELLKCRGIGKRLTGSSVVRK